MSTSYASLDKIRIKVRRLTKHLSTSQISDSDIDDYINVFMLYDMPELDLNELKTTATFFTKPYVSEYDTNTTDSNDPLYNFKNLITDGLPEIYIDGTSIETYKSSRLFYIDYPNIIDAIALDSTGDGVTTAFSGTLDSKPIIPGEVAFSSITSSYEPVVVKDVPADNQLTGTLIVPDNPASVGTINYVTGAYSFTFPTAPATSESIYSHTITYEDR